MSLSIKEVPLLWKIAHVSPIVKGKGKFGHHVPKMGVDLWL
jgi:hypothetical protein